MSEATATTAPRAVALLVTADDAVFGVVSNALARDGAVRSLRRARSLNTAVNALRTVDPVVVLADPRVEDASVEEVAAWLRTLDLPAVVLVPERDAHACLGAVTTDLPHHVLAEGTPWQLLATSVHRAVAGVGPDVGYAEWRDRLAVVRHEMATPLSAIEGFLEALIAHGEKLPADRRRDSLEAAYRNAGRLRRLVAELNAVAKATGPAADTNLQLIELRPTLVRLVRDLGPRGEGIRVGVPGDLLALADTDHLTAIIGNLVDNATKYGQPPIEVKARKRDGHIQVAVIDHGDGVPDHFLPRMFERYTRAHEVRDRRRGSGIGLALCAELADAMGGSLSYEEARDGGAIFVLTLLAERAAARVSEPVGAGSVATSGGGGDRDDAAAGDEGHEDQPDVVIDVAAIEAENLRLAAQETAEARAGVDAAEAAEQQEQQAEDVENDDDVEGVEDGARESAEPRLARDDLPAFDALAWETPGAPTNGNGNGNGHHQDREEALRRARPVAGGLEVVRDGLYTHTTVGLGFQGRAVEGHASGAATIESSTRAVVRATLDAVESFLDGAARFDIERVRIDGADGDEHVTVTITAITEDGFERLVGAALTRDDAQRAAMYATLDALNRRIERLLV